MPTSFFKKLIASLFIINLVTPFLWTQPDYKSYSSNPVIAAMIEKDKANTSAELSRAIDQKRDFNEEDTSGQTPLNAAIFYNYLDIAKELIKNGADPNHEDGQGNTPLMIAIDKQNYKAAKMLIKNGADINYVNKKGQTALSRLAEKWTPGRDYTNIANLFREEGAKGPNGENFADFAKTQDPNSKFAEFAKTSTPLTPEELLEALNKLSVDLQALATITSV